MSSVQAVTTPPEPAARQRKHAPEGAEFAALVAQFASRTSIHTGAAGRLSLAIGARMQPGARGAPAQESTNAETESAREQTSLREPEHAREPAGRDNEARARTGRAAPEPSRGPQSWSASTAQAKSAANPANAQAHPAPPDRPQHESARDRQAGDAASAKSPVVAAIAQPTRPQAGAQAADAAGRTVGAVTGKAGLGPTPSGGAQAQFSFGAGAQHAGHRAPAAAARAPAGAEAHAPRDAAPFRAQLAHGLGAALRRGDGEVTLRLRPEVLGDLRVQLRVTGDIVDAKITASTAEAHRLLEQSVDTLRAALESRGLHAGKIEIEPGAHTARHEHTAAEPHPDGAGPEARTDQHGERASEEPTPERGVRGGAAGSGGGPQDDGPGESLTLGSMDHPGVVYGVADGAARIVMVDALA